MFVYVTLEKPWKYKTYTLYLNSFAKLFFINYIWQVYKYPTYGNISEFENPLLKCVSLRLTLTCTKNEFNNIILNEFIFIQCSSNCHSIKRSFISFFNYIILLLIQAKRFNHNSKYYFSSSTVNLIYLRVCLTTILFNTVCKCALNTFVNRLQHKDINVLTKQELFEWIFDIW